MSLVEQLETSVVQATDARRARLLRLPLFTASAARTFRRCAREYHLHYGLGYRPIETAGPMRFGSLIHSGLEAWWRAFPKERHVWTQNALEDHPGVDPFDLVRAEELLRGYTCRWGDAELEVLAVEVEFLAELVNPETGAPSRTFSLAGRIDAIARDAGGRVWVVEHKTSSEDIGAGSEYWRRLTLDAQVSTYIVGARSLGYEPVGCLYDVLGKPRLEPYKATPVESRKYKKTGELYANQRETDETPEEFRARLREHIATHPERYYQRGEVVRLEDEERDAAFDAWQTARAIRDAELANRHPRNADACTRWGRTCPYFDPCCGLGSLEDQTKFRRAERPHEELTLTTTKETT